MQVRNRSKLSGHRQYEAKAYSKSKSTRVRTKLVLGFKKLNIF